MTRRITTYNGRSVADMSRDELVAALTDAALKARRWQGRAEDAERKAERVRDQFREHRGDGFLDRLAHKTGLGKWWH